MAATLRSWSRKLASADLQARALHDAGPAVATAALQGMRQAMRQGVSPDGTPYAPLARPRPGGGAKPLNATGLLASSLSASVTAEGLLLKATAPGARLMQSGGTVQAKSGGSLAVPVTAEARRVGSPRQFPRPLFVLRKHGSARGGVLAERVGHGRGAGVVVHYVLTRSVTVPARPFLGLTKDAMRAADGAIGSAYAKLLAGCAK